MKGIERSEMIDNRAQLHGLMRNAMERVSVPIKKGVQHFSPLMIDRHFRCAKKTNDIADVEKNDGMK